MRYLFTFCLLLLCMIDRSLCNAQDGDVILHKIDSLKHELAAAKEDAHKVDLYVELFASYMYGHSEDGLAYIPAALELSERLDYKLESTNFYAGRMYWKLGKTDTALKYHFEALRIAEEKGLDTRVYLTAIGQDYADGSNYEKALEYFIRIKDLNIKLDAKGELAEIHLLISWVYGSLGNYPESSKHNLEALKLHEEVKDEYGAAIAASNLASDFAMLDKHNEAIYYYKISNENLLKSNDLANLSTNYVNLSKAYYQVGNIPQAFKYAELSFTTAKQIADFQGMGRSQGQLAELYILEGEHGKAIPHLRSAVSLYRGVNTYPLLIGSYSQLGICYLRTQQPVLAKEALDSAQYFSQIDRARIYMQGYLYGRQLYDSLMGNWKSAYLQHYQYVGLRDSIYNDDNTKKLMQTQLQYQFDKKEAAAKVAQEVKDAIAKRELQRQKMVRNGFVIGFAVVMLFAGVFFTQRNRIGREKRRSDELLLNILPEEIAEELKEKGSADAKQFDEVTVMFTDFQGFTKISEKLTPKELVDEIHTCFKAFDRIIEKYNIEKIKTIGDSYMCAGGLPVANRTNAQDVVRAALEIQQFMDRQFLERKNSGKEAFQMRIGIHTGPVVAGIVGVRKFAYDIWGDTVNLASRMESSGEVGKVNISGTTYELVKESYNCTYRGKVSARSKGEIDMYFVEAYHKTA